MEVEEGGVTIEVPELAENGTGDAVFYNPRQERNRDITVATLRALRCRDSDLETYLDAMTASGVRAVRAAADEWAVTACDRTDEAIQLCRRNFDRNGLHARLRTTDANVLLHQEHHDVVDLDPFGSPMPFAAAAFAGTGRILCVTATDTAPLCGAHLNAGIRRYGAVPRNTEYHAEMGVRILLSALCRTAATRDIAIEPILSHAESHYVRTYLRLKRGATVADEAIEELGMLWHCPQCLYRESTTGLLPTRRERCPHCDGEALVTAGPLWLGAVHDTRFVEEVIDSLDQSMGTAEAAERMLTRIHEELPVPTHYDQHRLCKRWDRTAGPMDEWVAALQTAGYAASRTHYGGTTFKTDANVGEIRRATA